LEFKGVPQMEGEDINQIVVDLAELLDVKIDKNEISTVHLIGYRLNLGN